MASSDHFEGRCWLEWAANPSTVLASLEVTIVLTSRDDGWHAHGRLPDMTDEAREALLFLCEQDPVFTLRFEDRSTVDVTVRLLSHHGQFVLTEYAGSAESTVEPFVDLVEQ